MDEFSTLVAADTFAHGRLTNPTPPMYRHFETLHVLMQPSYNSKYMPGGALMLALGQRVFGHSVAGLWIATALSSGALVWMLMGWMPAEWAVLGGVLAIFYPLTSQWARYYLCCNFAVFGGALLLGAFRRLIRKPNVGCSLVFGLGISIVGLMRPYEGAMLSALVIFWLLFESRRFGFYTTVRRSLLPASLVIAVTVGFIGYYNWRVTGNPASFPYSVYASEYSTAPTFWLLSAGSSDVPERHRWASEFARGESVVYNLQHTFRGFVWYLAQVKVRGFWWRYKSVAFLGLPGLLLAFRNRMNRGAAIVFLAWFAALLLPTWLNHNYTAPGFALFFLLLMLGMRSLGGFRVGALPLGAWVVTCSILICIAARFTVVDPKPTYQEPYGDDRASVISRLTSTPGQHLVLVCYGAKHKKDAEWVYNDADIEHSRIIWARDLGPSANRELLEYYRDRRVWMLRPDESPPDLQEYSRGVNTAHLSQ
jgi:hypothetical protein